MTEIEVDPNNSSYSNNNSDGVLYNKNINTLIQYPIGNSATDFTIPDSVTTISDFAFYKSQNLNSVTIPTSVTSIGDRAFSECLTLAGINVNSGNTNYSNNDSDGVLYNNGVTTLIQYPIGNSATNFIIPNSVTTIDTGAFQGCTSLTNLTIPISVTTINDYAFFSCNSLEKIEFRGNTSAMGIGNNIFNDNSDGGITPNSTRNITFYNTATENNIQTSLLTQVQDITEDEDVYLYGDTTSGAQIFITTKSGPVPVILSVINLGSF